MTGVTKPKWKKVRNAVTNNKKIIESRADFENVKIIIQYELQRTQYLINLINC